MNIAQMYAMTAGFWGHLHETPVHRGRRGSSLPKEERKKRTKAKKMAKKQRKK